MTLRSLGLRTDLALLEAGGELLERSEYLVVRTPAEPGYFWGNLLVFPEAPKPGDFPAWREAFAREFADLPEVRHQTLAWDDPAGTRGATRDFEAAGFEFDADVTLVAEPEELRPPPRPCAELEVRPLEGDADWEEALANQIGSRQEGFRLGPYEAFKTRRMRALRALCEAGRGWWFGGFLGGRLVGDLGLFRVGELARYQSVGTHPDHRRRGVCGTLVHAAGRHALEAGAERLVICADPASDYGAMRIYESLGFRPRERGAGLVRPAPGSKADGSAAPAG